MFSIRTFVCEIDLGIQCCHSVECGYRYPGSTCKFDHIKPGTCDTLKRRKRFIDEEDYNNDEITHQAGYCNCPFFKEGKCVKNEITTEKSGTTWIAHRTKDTSVTIDTRGTTRLQSPTLKGKCYVYSCHASLCENPDDISTCDLVDGTTSCFMTSHFVGDEYHLTAGCQSFCQGLTNTGNGTTMCCNRNKCNKRMDDEKTKSLATQLLSNTPVYAMLTGLCSMFTFCKNVNLFALI